MGTVPVAEQLNFDVPSGISLRSELSLRGLRFASANGFLHEQTDGQVPSIIFGRTTMARHGNFHPAVYPPSFKQSQLADRFSNSCRSFTLLDHSDVPS